MFPEFNSDRLKLTTPTNDGEEVYWLDVEDGLNPSQDIMQTVFRIDPTKEIETMKDENGKSYYITLDGKKRFYHNPQTRQMNTWHLRLTYSLWSTVCPYSSFEAIREETQVPSSLTELDFFVNYINTKIDIEMRTGFVLLDKKTWNKYLEAHTDIDRVEVEGDAHRNIKRFLIDPHFTFFQTETEQAKLNTMYDLYKYFLCLEEWNRTLARSKATVFYDEYVKSVIESDFTRWFNSNVERLSKQPQQDKSRNYLHLPMNLYGSDNTTSFIRDMLEYNGEIFRSSIPWYISLYPKWEKLDKVVWPALSYDELKKVLIAYNVDYRRKSLEEAEKIVKDGIEKELSNIQWQLDNMRNEKVQPYKVLREPQYPNWFEDRDSASQDLRRMDSENKDKVGIYQQELTQEDKDYWINYFESKKFAPNH